MPVGGGVMAGPRRPYNRSDEVAEAAFRRGHAAETATADWLESLGVSVVRMPQVIRETYAQRDQVPDPGYDLIVEGRTIEVRHRAGYRFTGPDDFPFESVWFDDTECWDRGDPPRAHAYACVSGRDPRDLKGFLAVTEEVYPRAWYDWRPDSTRFDDNGEPALRKGVFIATVDTLSIAQFVAWARGQTELVVPGQQISFTDGWDPEDEDGDPPSLAAYQQQVREHNRRVSQQDRRREYLTQRAVEDAEKRAWIAEGHDLRQPPEYRGRVYDVPDRDGVHPTAFPPLREGTELTEEFIAFQAYNQTRYETHPQYYCVDCKIRYNARDGGRCGPCLSKIAPVQPPLRGSSSVRSRPQTADTQYPL